MLAVQHLLVELVSEGVNGLVVDAPARGDNGADPDIDQLRPTLEASKSGRLTALPL